MGKIQYSPELSIEQIAKISGVKEPTVRKYIRENFIDREYDSQLIRYRRVQQYFKENPDSTLSAAAAALGSGYSRNTVDKFRDPRNAPVPRKDRVFLSFMDPSMSKAAVASVSDEDRVILGIILRLNLKDDRFDCDFTFARGDFYEYGIQYPRYCLDLYPESSIGRPDAPEVKSLDDGEDMIPDNSLASAVIDLPQEISTDGVGTPGAFKDIRDLALSYYKMLSLAYRKLRYTSDTQSGGLLIVKVGDIRWKGKTIWLSKIVTELATGRLTRISNPVYEELRHEAEQSGASVEEKFPLFDLELTDKYVHTYDPDSISPDEEGRCSVKAHDYFLVFRKGRETIDYSTYYFASDEEIDRLPEGDGYGVNVLSRKSRVSGTHVYEVRLPLPSGSNHIDARCWVGDEIKRNLASRLGDEGAARTGLNLAYLHAEKFLRLIYEFMYDRLTEDSNPDLSFRVLPSSSEVKRAVADLLRDCGVKYIQWPQLDKRRPKDNYRIIIDPEAAILVKD